jgi:hypothetical protein
LTVKRALNRELSMEEEGIVHDYEEEGIMS